jgi:hypothetical protein
MTEVGEAVAVLMSMTKNNQKSYCDGEKSNPKDWKACIHDLAGPEPTPARLLRSMKKHQGVEGYDRPIPNKSKLKKRKGKWDIESCDSENFPFQSHHLIPKKHLPTHKVCTFLAKAYDKHEKYQLDHDNNYNTDHARNGFNMPFVTTTVQWADADGDAKKEEAAANLLMKKSHVQLHQGSHSYEDFGEEDDEIETEGYLMATDELLDRIFFAAVKHVKKCKICKKSDGKPDNIQPIESIVDQVDQVSLILLLKIFANEIFVSERAYNWFTR